MRIFVFNTSKIVFIRESFPRVLQLANTSIFHLADVQDELFLPFCSFFEPGSDSIEVNFVALSMKLTFAGLTRVIRTNERYFLAIGVDAHPFNGLAIVAFECLWVTDVETAQHDLKLSISMIDFFNLHLIDIKVQLDMYLNGSYSKLNIVIVIHFSIEKRIILIKKKRFGKKNKLVFDYKVL